MMDAEVVCGPRSVQLVVVQGMDGQYKYANVAVDASSQAYFQRSLNVRCLVRFYWLPWRCNTHFAMQVRTMACVDSESALISPHMSYYASSEHVHLGR